jgi:hypothetical protein
MTLLKPQSPVFCVPCEGTGCVPGTARILKGEPSFVGERSLASPRSSPMEAKDVAVWQPGIGDGVRGGGRPTEVGYRKRTG